MIRGIAKISLIIIFQELSIDTKITDGYIEFNYKINEVVDRSREDIIIDYY